MRVQPSCYPCALWQALRTVQRLTSDEKKLRKALDAAARAIAGVPEEESPTGLSELAIRAACAMIDQRDPYEEAKRESNRFAMGMVPRLREILAGSKDRLADALKLAVAGNVIDMGILPSFDVEQSVREVFRSGFAIDETDALRQELSRVNDVLYLGDNAGEIVFDKILVEELAPRKVVFVVKSGPILNDATIEDAVSVGMDEVAEVITTGCDSLGVSLSRSSPRFLAEFKRAKLIIAKGQANYETLDGCGANIFYLLKAKCREVARSLGVKEGDGVLKREERREPGAAS